MMNGDPPRQPQAAASHRHSSPGHAISKRGLFAREILRSSVTVMSVRSRISS
jgi:hypothetical protein